MQCNYAIFCDDVNYNSTTRKISVEWLFSRLYLDEPGTLRNWMLFYGLHLQTG